MEFKFSMQHPLQVFFAFKRKWIIPGTILSLLFTGLVAVPSVYANPFGKPGNENPVAVGFAEPDFQTIPTVDPKMILTPLTRTFGQLGFPAKTFHGPFDAADLQFSLPSEWLLASGSAITIKYTVKMPDSEYSKIKSTSLISYMYIHLNYEQIGFIPISKPGEFQVKIPVSQWVTPPLIDDSYLLEIIYKNDSGCINDNGITVLIDPMSSITFAPIERTTAPLLEKLPRPFYLTNSVIQDYATTIVLPDNPSEAELQAAMTTSAAMGSLSKSSGDISLVSTATLTDEIKQNNHLILVGKSLSLPLLSKTHLTTPLGTAGFQSGQIRKEDGVLQINSSPWNPARAVMLVSGDTDEAVIKASQALRTKFITVPGFYGLAVIKNMPDTGFTPAGETTSPGETGTFEKTLKDLGYKDTLISGIGTHAVDFYFPLQREFVKFTSATFDLTFTPSEDIEFSRSLMVVLVNGTPVNSFTPDKNSREKQVIKSIIPAGLLIAGKNTITVEMVLDAEDECATFMDIFGVWTRKLWTATIHEESLLRITTETGVEMANDVKAPQGLSSFADMLAFNPMLDNLAFVLPERDPAAWDAAARVAFILGNKSNYSQIERRPIMLRVFYSTEDPSEFLNYHIVLVGEHPEVAHFTGETENSKAGELVISPYDSPVSFRLLPGMSLGYIELTDSLWGDRHKMLILQGSGNIGLKLAGDVLIQEKYNGFLVGSAVVTNGSQVFIAKP
jgi:hypothetical protein